MNVQLARRLMALTTAVVVVEVSTVGCASASRTTNAGLARGEAEAAELRVEARVAYGARRYSECSALFSTARALGGDRITDAFDAACCHALAKDGEGAFRRLREAVDGGFHNMWQLEGDSDLRELHSDARWPAVTGQARANLEGYRKDASPELLELYREDQADRAGGAPVDWAVVGQRDAERRVRTARLMSEGKLRTAADHFHAAMIFQHGKNAEDYTRAHALAVRAVELDPTDEPAHWLAATALDRQLMSTGKPQRYGTQYRKVDGRWELYQTDESVTDVERARWNVQPLANARAHVEEMNAPRH